MTLDELDLFQPVDDPTRNTSTKKCRRHDWTPDYFVTDFGDMPASTMTCARCGAVHDPARSRRSRNNKNRGLAIQRKRIEGLGGTNLAGNNENLDGIGLAFAYESKSGGSFSERVWRWLVGIPTKGDQTGVLIVTETPGPGRRARSYVVVEYDEWKALHGESKEDVT